MIKQAKIVSCGPNSEQILNQKPLVGLKVSQTSRSNLFPFQFDIIYVYNGFSRMYGGKLNPTICELTDTKGLLHQFASMDIQDDLIIDSGKTREVALACKMVGGGSDGSLDLGAKICIIDEYENILFRSYVKPHLPVTHYRYRL
ncbi:hypothetical protein L2E82_05784 [Cichorium intybus]|uniref:Uncharacterized protein n=1 Tax=Cichorium intybus TaxID=13427 RepID=A0ACB9H7S3_CICIN|nr:hypothetical protein L2E82_05784 [Cichorium intybus]